MLVVLEKNTAVRMECFKGAQKKHYGKGEIFPDSHVAPVLPGERDVLPNTGIILYQKKFEVFKKTNILYYCT